MRSAFVLLVLALVSLALGGCAVAHLAGAMARSAEMQKEIEVLAQYRGLEGHRVAVVVDADLGIVYDNPGLIPEIAGGVSGRIQQHVSDVAVLDPMVVLSWQYRTPQWNVMPFSQMCEQLEVDRIVFVEIYEYRLTPPGNRWVWEGVCAANVGIIESDGFSPDIFIDTYEVLGQFPMIENVPRESAEGASIRYGLVHKFVEGTAWLFYDHLEPKYPEYYRPELNQGS